MIKGARFGGSEAFAGVGRANNNSNVGNANNVYGVAGANTFTSCQTSPSLPIIERKRQNMYNGMLVSRETENW